MSRKRLGAQTIALENPPSVEAYANIGGKQEGKGPLAVWFDELNDDSFFGEKSWEKAESFMQKTVLRRTLDRAQVMPRDVDAVLGGDLLNQCIGTSFGLREFGIPFYGLYSACATMGEALSMAAMLIDGGFAERTVAMASSHFCAAERQYRMPVPYGSQRTPTSQWTATAAGCVLLRSEGSGPYLTHAVTGKMEDLGIKDPNNMGAAMAPAAYSTLTAFFRETKTAPEDYDLIVTGDLGELGHAVVKDLFERDGVFLGDRYQDCGMLLFDRERQDMHAGASGAGCSASVLAGYLLGGLRSGRWKKLLFAPTGALLSTTSSFQGETIPGICHAVCFSAER